MYRVALAGGIASGKSTVARELVELGCARIDLDEVSREVVTPGSPCLQEVADAFGADVIHPETGALDRALLARRAFATSDAARALEAIMMPAIRRRLAERLAQLAQPPEGPAVCVVEVPLLDRIDDLHALVDEVVVVWCPLDLRRKRAVLRGMIPEDFDARVANQPDDAWLRAHADVVLVNDGDEAQLHGHVVAWYHEALLRAQGARA